MERKYVGPKTKNDLEISIVEGIVEVVKGRPGDELDKTTLKCQGHSTKEEEWEP